MLLFFVSTININAQIEKLNDYKYILIPKKFDFVNKVDKYQTSSLTKFLLKKNGLDVFFNDENLPQELNQNRCLSLVANVVDKSGMFITKSTIEFRDCKGNLIYSTQIGTSKLKEYKKAFQQSIRRAHSSMTNFIYSYSKKDDKKRIKIANKPVVIHNNKTTKGDNVKEEKKDMLYAQSKPNGFQLINTKPEVVFYIYKTNLIDVFIIKEKNGILYKNKNSWIAEFYHNNKLLKKEYHIKF